MEPIDRLAAFLSIHYPHLTIDIVKLSPKAGYIVEKGSGKSICIQGVGYSQRRGSSGQRNSINRLWSELHDYYDTHVDIIKVKKRGISTVILWQGLRYAYDQNFRKVTEHVFGRERKSTP